MSKRLLQLLAENRRPFEPIESKIISANSDGQAAIYLYDPIVGDRATAEWWGGVCPQDFVPALRALDAEEITLYTNCPGGDVFAAEAMCQALREHKAKITMQIEGYAASAATAIACACDEVVATAASKYMIHQTWTIAIGNADDMDHVAELLRKCDGTMYDAYEARTGQARDQIEAWCKAETWFTAAEAVEARFVDRVLEASPSARAAARHWNLSAYSNGPRSESPAPPAKAPQDPPAPTVAYATQDHRDRQQQRMQMLARTRQ